MVQSSAAKPTALPDDNAMTEPNEHIEYFKRFVAAYMRWVRFSFDRIVREVVTKHTTG